MQGVSPLAHIMDFYTSITDYYDYIFPVSEVKASLITDYIGSERENILDIGCSTGGFSEYITDKGAIPYGIDLNDEMLSIAKGRVRSEISGNFVSASMLDVDKVFNNVDFDLAFSVGNTVAHLTDIDQLNRLFASVKSVLKPDGLFVIQVVNYNRYDVDRETKLPIIDNDKIRFEREYCWKRTDGRVNFDTVLTDKSTNQQITNREVLTPFLPEEIIRQAKDNGFGVVDTFGAFNRTEFDPENSFAFILVVKR
ncbi:MAG: class I SAM-dependent methyltransferase [Bacteroidales bacterium]|jgi:SAM-dependent methyltransferase|nr:class I SAM-dependent methyltransferase [Bacteroidales bacterium]